MLWWLVKPKRSANCVFRVKCNSDPPSAHRSPPASCCCCHPPVSLWLTDAGDPLGDQVFQESINDRVVSGVQLVSINPNVEAEPVRVGVGRQLPCWAELVHVAFSIPGRGEEEEGDKLKSRQRIVRFLRTEWQVCNSWGAHMQNYNNVINDYYYYVHTKL